MSAAGTGGAIAPAAAGGSDYSEANTRLYYPELRHWGRGDIRQTSDTGQLGQGAVTPATVNISPPILGEKLAVWDLS